MPFLVYLVDFDRKTTTIRRLIVKLCIRHYKKVTSNNTGNPLKASKAPWFAGAYFVFDHSMDLITRRFTSLYDTITVKSKMPMLNRAKKDLFLSRSITSL